MVPLRAVIVEDRAADAEILLRELRRAGFEPSARVVDNEKDYLEALAAPLDVVLSDFNLPHFDGLRAMRIVEQKRLHVPVIIVTGALGDERAAECLREGAADYLLKDRLARLGAAVAAATGLERLVEEKKQVAARLDDEIRFRELAERLGEVFFVLAPDARRFLYVSPAYETVWGRPCQSLTDRPESFVEAVHPLDRAKVAGALGRTTGAAELRYRIVREGGAVRWILSRTFPVRDEAGAVVEIVGVAGDVTDLEKAEAERARLAAIVESASDAIFALSRDRAVTSWNHGAERLFGVPAAEAIGRPFATLLPAADAAESDAFERVITGETADAHESRRLVRGGETLDVALTESPIRDQGGEIVGVSVIARDVGFRKRSREEPEKESTP